MRAAICRRYGPPEAVRIEQVPAPEPGARDVLVRVYATTVTSGDWRTRALAMPPGFKTVGRLMLGFRGPRQPILGTELAGIVEAVGSEVAQFRVGEAVFAFPGSKMGAHAEYRVLPEAGNLLPKPANLTLAEAAAIAFGGTTALHFLRDKAHLRAGERLLINGASGGVGSAAVQLARQLGAEVTAVCREENHALVQQLGAAKVIDYRQCAVPPPGEAYDGIMDCVGTLDQRACLAGLKPGGRLIKIVDDVPAMGQRLRLKRPEGRRVITGAASERRELLADLAELCTLGHFRPVIGQEFPFEEIVAAHREAESGHKRGNCVVQLKSPTE